MLLMKEAMLLTAETGKQVMACPGSTCIGGDFVGSTCTEEEEGQQLEGRKTGQHMHLGFFWAAHALEEILGAAHAFGFFLGSTCIGGDFVGSTCTEEEEGQQLGGGRKRAAAGSKSADPQPAIVWASSSSVYGLNSKVPFSEKDRTDRPASLYAATKKAGEAIAHTYNHIYGLSITGLRFFTVYGPWGRPDMAYFFFTRDILTGKPITIFEGPDHGSVARDFTYIDDIVKGCLASLDTAKKSTGTGGKKKGAAQFRIFNLGNTSPVDVSKLVSILEKLLKVKAKRRVLPMPRNGDVQYTHANISLAQRELGYKPTTDLESGLKKFVRWYITYQSKSKKKSSW
eukprot:XP_010662214.1 PREDICTED: UDP-glucuronate 4-epimerase 5 [Vitis vinifera]